MNPEAAPASLADPDPSESVRIAGLDAKLRRLLRWAYRDMALEPQRRTASWSRFSTPRGGR